MPARLRVPGGGLDARYEQRRHAALHGRVSAFPLGLGVLTSKGVTAWGYWCLNKTDREAAISTPSGGTRTRFTW